MKAIVLLLALASAAFADEYTPVDWLVVTESSGVALYIEDGEFKWVVGAFTYIQAQSASGLETSPLTTRRILSARPSGRGVKMRIPHGATCREQSVPAAQFAA